MNKLSHERMARAVLDKLLDSGELRSVASDRAVAQLVHYLPPVIALAVPAVDEFADLLNPERRDRAIQGVSEALSRIVAHEEREHWVALSSDVIALTVTLREQSTLLRANPVYEPELEPLAGDGERLGQPRLRIAWQAAGDERSVVFRQGQGLLDVDLGSRAPSLWVLQADDDALKAGTVAYLLSDAPAQVGRPDGALDASPMGTRGGRGVVAPARTRVPIAHDVEIHLQRPWWKVWRRDLTLQVEVLGLARSGRPDLSFSSSAGEQRRWDRNQEPVIELAADLFVHAQAEDRLGVQNAAELPAYVLWHQGAQLEVPAGAQVTVQGSHVQGILSPASTMWAASSAGFHAPPPRVLELIGRLAAAPPTAEQADANAPLFGFERRAALVFQDAAVLTGAAGSSVEIAVRSQVHAGPIATIALDDCAGAKVAYPTTGGPAHSETSMFRQVHDVVPLGASGARLELLGAPLAVFAVPTFVRELSADPEDAWVVGKFKFRVTTEGLDIERVSPGDDSVEVNGIAYPGNARVGFDERYRVRVADGVYRVVRLASDASAKGWGDAPAELG